MSAQEQAKAKIDEAAGCCKKTVVNGLDKNVALLLLFLNIFWPGLGTASLPAWIANSTALLSSTDSSRLWPHGLSSGGYGPSSTVVGSLRPPSENLSHSSCKSNLQFKSKLMNFPPYKMYEQPISILLLPFHSQTFVNNLFRVCANFSVRISIL